MRAILNSLHLAFSMYSVLPERQIEKNSENTKYLLCFVPWVGAIMAFLISEWGVASPYLLDHEFMRAVVCVMISTLLSGGAYLDGFFRTVDAISSHKPMGGKLEILQDSHSGYFATISCVCYFLVIVGLWTEIPLAGWPLVSMGFVISRSIYGLSILWLKHSMESKCTVYVSEGMSKYVTTAFLILYVVLCAVFMVSNNTKVGIGCLVGVVIAFLYYVWVAYKHFGGITEDIAGFFVQVCEIAIPLMALIMYRGNMDLTGMIEY